MYDVYTSLPQDYLEKVPGRKRRLPSDREEEDDDITEKRTSSKEEKEAERKARYEQKKEWTTRNVSIDESVMPFIERHAKRMKRYIEATYT